MTGRLATAGRWLCHQDLRRYIDLVVACRAPSGARRRSIAGVADDLHALDVGD